MHCPECKTEYVCPCESCRKREPNKIAWEFIGDDKQACSGCGLIKDSHEWMNIEFEQYQKAKSINPT